jgi:tetratricopeptide (TPR) repeat protein
MLKRMSLCALLTICFLNTAPVCLANDDAREAIRRGNSRVAKEQYEEAIKEYQRVKKTSGDLYATARYNIGVCNYELSRSAEAVAEYRAAIEARRSLSGKRYRQRSNNK